MVPSRKRSMLIASSGSSAAPVRTRGIIQFAKKSCKSWKPASDDDALDATVRACGQSVTDAQSRSKRGVRKCARSRTRGTSTQRGPPHGAPQSSVDRHAGDDDDETDDPLRTFIALASWKTINGHRDYYKSECDGGRVKTTYFGAGESGLLISRMQAIDREDETKTGSNARPSEV